MASIDARSEELAVLSARFQDHTKAVSKEFTDLKQGISELASAVRSDVDDRHKTTVAALLRSDNRLDVVEHEIMTLKLENKDLQILKKIVYSAVGLSGTAVILALIKLVFVR